MTETIGVVGSGTMGNGIAQVAARAGYGVVMRDVKDEFLERGLKAIDKSLQRDVDKQRLTAEEKQAVIGRIQTTTELDALSGASFVIEAVTEDLPLKPRQAMLVKQRRCNSIRLPARQLITGRYLR